MWRNRLRAPPLGARVSSLRLALCAALCVLCTPVALAGPTTLSVLVVPDVTAAGPDAATMAPAVQQLAALAISAAGLSSTFKARISATPVLPTTQLAALAMIYEALSRATLPVAVVSPCSDASPAALAIADALRALGVPLFTYTPLAESDAGVLRVAPAYGILARAMVSFASLQGWTAVTIVSSTSVRGLDGASRLREAAVAAGVHVSSSRTFDAGNNTSQAALAASIAGEYNEVVVLAWLGDDEAPSLYSSIAAAGAFSSRVTWVSSSGVLPSVAPSSCRGLVVINAASDTSQDVAVAYLSSATATSLAGLGNADDLYLADATYFAIAALAASEANFSASVSACTTSASPAQCLSVAAVAGASRESLAANFTALLATPVAVELLARLPFSTGVTTWAVDEFSGGQSAARTGYVISAQSVSPVGALGRFATYTSAGTSGVWRVASAPVWTSGSTETPGDGTSLKGSELLVAMPVGASMPLVFLPTSPGGAPSGYGVQTLEAVAAAVGFTYRIELVNTSQVTYDEMLARLAAGEWDMIVGDMIITNERLKVVDFSSEFFSNSARLVIKRPPPAAVDVFAFLRPFSLGVWLCWLSSILITGTLSTVYTVFEEYDANAASLSAKRVLSLAPATYAHGIGLYLGEGGWGPTRESVCSKATSAVTMFTGAIAFATYTGAVAASLTEGLAQRYISTLADVRVLPPNQVGLVAGDAIEVTYRQLEGTAYRSLGLSTTEELYGYVSSGALTVLIDNDSTAKYMTESVSCDLITAGEAFWPNSFGFAFPRSWNANKKYEINGAILSLDITGTLSTFRQNAWGSPRCPAFVGTSTVTSGQITLNELGGLLASLVVVQVAIFVAYLAQRCTSITVRRLSSRDKAGLAPAVVAGVAVGVTVEPRAPAKTQ